MSNYIFSGVRKGLTRNKSWNFFSKMCWVRGVAQKTYPNSSLQFRTHKRAHTKKEVHRKPNKGGIYVSKPGKNACIETQNIAQVFILQNNF
jgi:homospermidine synthase